MTSYWAVQSVPEEAVAVPELANWLSAASSNTSQVSVIGPLLICGSTFVQMMTFEGVGSKEATPCRNGAWTVSGYMFGGRDWANVAVVTSSRVSRRRILIFIAF